MNIEIWDSLMQARLDTNNRILSGDYYKALSSLKNAILDIGNFWQGTDYDYFLKTITPFLDDLSELETSLQSYHEFLGGYIKAHQMLNDRYQSKTISLK